VKLFKGLIVSMTILNLSTWIYHVLVPIDLLLVRIN